MTALKLPTTMTSFPRAYGEWVVRWRWPVLLVSLLLTLAVGASALGQRYYNPNEIWFLPDDPDLVTYRQLVRQYGKDNFILVAFRDPGGVFTNRALEAVLELTRRLETTPFVEKVSSVANYQAIASRITARGEDELIVGDLVKRDELPLSADELARRERRALGEAPILGSFLGPPDPASGRPVTTAVVARVAIDDEVPEHAVTVVERVLAVTREFERAFGYRTYLAGMPVAEHAFATFGKQETLRFTSLLLGTVAVLLAVLFRRVPPVILPCAVVILAMAAALGVMAWFRIWLNPLTTVVPQILITVGIAEAIHMVATFYEARRHGVARDRAVVRMVEETFTPCLVTSLTTAIGFASLVFASVVPMRELGMAACVGVAFAWLLSFTVVPATLALWPGGRTGRARARDDAPAAAERWLDRALGAVGRMSAHHPWRVLLGMLGVFALIMAFAAKVRVETSYTNMFKPATLLRQGIDFIDANLGGPVDIEVSLDSGRSDGVKDPAFLAKLADIQAFVASQPKVSQTFSVVDIVTRMNEAMHGGDRAFRHLPDDAATSAQYFLLYTLSARDDDLKDRIDVDNRWTRLSARVRLYSSAETQGFGERIRRFIRERYPELAANVTGKALLYTSMQDGLAASTVNSFAAAVLPIALVQAVLFRSLKIGLLSMIPNLLPILALAGIMGLVGIPLDPGSAIVGNIAIGIVVDDTVHFFSRYLRIRQHGVAPAQAVERSLRDVGRPVVYTTTILALGFSLFGLSQFNFIAYFGQLAAVVIVLALLADFLMTPALLVVCDTARHPLVRRLRKPRSAVATGIAVATAAALLGMPSVAEAGPAEDRGLAIMQEQERVKQGFKSEVNLYRMTLVNANGDRSERTMEFRTLEGGREGDKTLIVFKAPADIGGTALLTYQNRSGEDDQWLYLPSVKRVKRIAGSSRTSSFVGSEFTYEDLVPMELAKYRFRYLRDDTVEGTPVWVVESVPQIKESGYSRLELHVRRDNHQTARTNFYDRKGDLLKVASFERWTRMGRWWRAPLIRMENQQTKKSTVLETLDLKVPAGLGAGDFATRVLGR